jgi:nicotinate-nucleotide adenylyltransferase
VRLGIFGGTFNPPHLGHLVCAQEAYLHLRLDLVMLVPARIPPHKPVEDEPGPQHRLELCRIATRDDERFVVSDMEIRRGGPSYTVDTLKELTTTHPDTDLFLILGGDVAAGLPRWHEPERVISLATLAVAERRGTARADIDAAVGPLAGANRTAFFPMPTIDVSSTTIRQRVRTGEPIRYIVPDAVIEYTREHRLYVGERTT